MIRTFASRFSSRSTPRQTAWVLSMVVAIIAMTAVAHAQAVAEADAPGRDLDISLLTIGPGDVYFERFGHNAIVVRDQSRGTAIAYNYGIFDFGQQDFFLNFARGRMQYLIAANAYADDVAMYREEGRSIVEQKLALPPVQRAALRDFLEWNALPQNAAYRYDYFTANCSTRVRDVLDRALGGAIRRATQGRATSNTYRTDALRLMAPQPALMLLIDLGLGPFADQKLDLWQESFVPMVLSQAIRTVTEPGDADVSVSGAQITIAPSRIVEPPDQPPDLRIVLLVIGLALGCLIIVLGRLHGNRAARITLGIIGISVSLFCGVGGCVLLALWGLTDHVAAWRNENLLLLNPLCFLMLPTWFAAFRFNWHPRPWTLLIAWLIAGLAGLELLFKVLPWFVQANLHWILLWLPIHLAFATVLSRRTRIPVA